MLERNIVRASSIVAMALALTAATASGDEPVDTAALLSRADLKARVSLSLPNGRIARLRPERSWDHPKIERVVRGEMPLAAARSVSGAVEGGGRFVLAESGDDAYGAIWSADGSFELRGIGRRDAQGRALVEVVAVPGNLPRCVAGVAHDRPDDDDQEELGGREHAGPDGDLTRGAEDAVRVFFAVDTSVLGNISGGEDRLSAYCAALISSANDAYENSEATGVRLQLAGVEVIEFPGNYTSSQMLRLLTGVHDGVADEAHAFRDAYGADLIAGLVDIPSFCGVAWVAPNNPQQGVSLTDYDCALGNLTFAHEVGHNFGCAHDPDNAGSSFASFGFGHRWNSDSRRSVMSYAPGTRVPYFSNPSVTESGSATGIANERDNARLLRQTMPTLASHRFGIGDQTDCDGSGVPDAVEIAGGELLDENKNGIPDICDIRAGAEDCNGNGRLDAYEIEPNLVVDSGLFELAAGSLGTRFSMPAPPAASAGVELEIVAYGDFSSSSETITLVLNDSVTETFFVSGGGDCAAAWNAQSRFYTADLFNAVAADGLNLQLGVTSSVNVELCALPATARVLFRYRTMDTSADPLGGGPLDACLRGCIADLTHVLTVPGDPGYGEPDGEVSVIDLTYYVEAWLNEDLDVADLTHVLTVPGDPGYGEPDGEVSVIDLTYYVEAWLQGCQ